MTGKQWLRIFGRSFRSASAQSRMPGLIVGSSSPGPTPRTTTGARLLTCHDPHYRLAEARLVVRAETLTAAHAVHPSAFAPTCLIQMCRGSLDEVGAAYAVAERSLAIVQSGTRYKTRELEFVSEWRWGLDGEAQRSNCRSWLRLAGKDALVPRETFCSRCSSRILPTSTRAASAQRIRSSANPAVAVRYGTASRGPDRHDPTAVRGTRDLRCRVSGLTVWT
jgi:hypothetical protein